MRHVLREIIMHHETDRVTLQRECANSATFEALARIAVREIEKYAECCVVCGPISTGGAGSLEKNFARFTATIALLQQNGVVVFDCGPYEQQISILRKQWLDDHPEATYCTPILEVFYRSIFNTRRIQRAFFLPGWETSHGACWEREQLQALGVTICDIEPESLEELLRAA